MIIFTLFFHIFFLILRIISISNSFLNGNIYRLYFLVPCWGARHTFAFLAFLGFANVYAMRVNLSVAIVAMVNHTAIDHRHNSSNLSEYFLGPTSNIQGEHCKKLLYCCVYLLKQTIIDELSVMIYF